MFLIKKSRVLLLLSILIIFVNCSKESLSQEPTESGCGIYPAQGSSAYVLPYSIGKAYNVSQSNCGAFSHSGAFQFSYDFRMDIGTLVTASRSGTVVFVEESKPNGTTRMGDENLVVVDHGDNSFGRYIHLDINGALVEVGDRVSQGDSIGWSGNSGLSIEPHLHFDVTEGCSQSTCQSIPVVFLNTEAHATGLEEGKTYTAENYTPSSAPCGTYPGQQSSPYVLPYPSNTTYTILQGNCGDQGHIDEVQFAYDFAMDIGTVITAARAGMVIFVEESNTDSTTQQDAANLIIIRHDDNTFSRYFNLTQNGALVNAGQQVAQGDTIARSGNSGSITPHLHFDVTENCPQASCQSIPLVFSNTVPHPNGLVEGLAYTAQPSN